MFKKIVVIIFLALFASSLAIADGWLYSRINHKQAELRSLQQRKNKLKTQLKKVKKKQEQIRELKKLWPRMVNSFLTPEKWEHYKIDIQKKVPCQKVTDFLTNLQPSKRHAEHRTGYWLVPKKLQVKRLDNKNYRVDLKGRINLYAP